METRDKKHSLVPLFIFLCKANTPALLIRIALFNPKLFQHPEKTLSSTSPQNQDKMTIMMAPTKARTLQAQARQQLPRIGLLIAPSRRTCFYQSSTPSKMGWPTASLLLSMRAGNRSLSAGPTAQGFQDLSKCPNRLSCSMTTTNPKGLSPMALSSPRSGPAQCSRGMGSR